MHRGAKQVQGSFLRQKVGIPQGSVLSTLLCTLILEDIEAKHLTPLLSQAANVCFCVCGRMANRSPSDARRVVSGLRFFL